MPEAAGLPIAERRPVCLAGILDDDQAVPIGDRRIMSISATRPEMDPGRWPGPRRDRGLDPLCVDEIRVRPDVDEDRRGTSREDRVGGRGERVRHRDHLVAGLQADPGEDRHQGEGSVADRDRVTDTDEVGPEAFQLGYLATLGDHPAAEDLGHGGDLLGAQVRAGDRDHAVLLGGPGPLLGRFGVWTWRRPTQLGLARPVRAA